MALSSNSQFSMKALTDAVNLLPKTATQIRALNLFLPKFVNTTKVAVEYKDDVLTLVQTSERGKAGTASTTPTRSKRTFEIPHLVRNDLILAEDVQNVHAFGDPNKAESVNDVVLERLQTMKDDIELTREHMQFGALLGDIKDADGSTLFNIYTEFGVARKTDNWKLSTKTTAVGALMDATKNALRKEARGEVFSKFLVLCSSEFMQALKYHPNVEKHYQNYMGSAAYREDLGWEFEHNGVRFVEYFGEFGEKASKLEAGSALILPMGTRNTFREYFAPADTNSAVNTIALPLYAQREKAKLDKGWELEVQSNPLPMLLRPDLVRTVTME